MRPHELPTHHYYLVAPIEIDMTADEAFLASHMILFDLDTDQLWAFSGLRRTTPEWTRGKSNPEVIVDLSRVVYFKDSIGWANDRYFETQMKWLSEEMKDRLRLLRRRLEPERPAREFMPRPQKPRYQK